MVWVFEWAVCIVQKSFIDLWVVILNDFDSAYKFADFFLSTFFPCSLSYFHWLNPLNYKVSVPGYSPGGWGLMGPFWILMADLGMIEMIGTKFRNECLWVRADEVPRIEDG